MTSVFTAARLPMARSLRRLTGTALAKAAEVSPEWLSRVERGHETPSDELVGRLARALELPVGFFFRDTAPLPLSEAFHFRASSKLAQKDELAARSLAALASEMSEWMDASYQLPIPGVPDVQELIGGEVATEPEIAAELLRSHWGLGNAPISSMVGLLEVKGARIFSVSGQFQAIDAFSFRHHGSAIIFLNPTKSAERLRFDLAHELGHLLLHGGSLYEGESRTRERQANDFAAAFLMPRSGLLGSLRGDVSLDHLPQLRDHWRVSAMALTVRLHQLGVISDWTYRMYCQELARRGFRRAEPGSTLRPEVSSLWAQILADLRERGLGYAHLANLLQVRVNDVQSLLVGLAPITLLGGSVDPTPSRGDLRLLPD